MNGMAKVKISILPMPATGTDALFSLCSDTEKSFIRLLLGLKYLSEILPGAHLVKLSFFLINASV
jgi:hypothetical protein